MKAYVMPHELRPVLARGAGEVIRCCGDHVRTALKALKYLSNCSLVIAVGDVVCSSLMKAGLTPSICIIDFKTKRHKSVPEVLTINEELFDKVIRVRNPPSMITEDALKAIELSVNAARRGSKTLVIVDGEEDLLTLPATIKALSNECVVYGKPDEGLSIIRVNDEVKKSAMYVFSRFKEVILDNR